MSFQIFEGALFGAIAGLLVMYIFKGSNKQVQGGKKMNDKLEIQQNLKPSLMDRWSVRLALVGVGLGIFATLSMGYTKIGFMIGFAIPMSIILGGIGLIIDLFRFRKK